MYTGILIINVYINYIYLHKHALITTVVYVKMNKMPLKSCTYCNLYCNI